MPSTLHLNERLHIAIIMDGNGRWATRRGLPRPAGHRAGVAALRRIIAAAPGLGIATLTLFAFSCDNWRRPAAEVDALMWLMRAYLRAATKELAESGVRLSVIGRRDRMPAALIDEIARAEAATARGDRLHLRIALDYSSREAIACAVVRCATGLPPSLDLVGKFIADALADDATVGGEVDLLIRTGGEKRLSDFLLWECAYAELWFTDTMWPDFDAAALRLAIDDFYRRERRFGGLGRASAETIPNCAIGAPVQ
jgi:undecaprenyl diphosphate synthase